MTGRVHFGTYGLRDEFAMDIVELHVSKGIQKVRRTHLLSKRKMVIYMFKEYCHIFNLLFNCNGEQESSGYINFFFR